MTGPRRRIRPIDRRTAPVTLKLYLRTLLLWWVLSFGITLGITFLVALWIMTFTGFPGLFWLQEAHWIMWIAWFGMVPLGIAETITARKLGLR